MLATVVVMDATLFNDSLDEDSFAPHLPIPDLPSTVTAVEPTPGNLLDNSLCEQDMSDTQLPFGFEDEFKRSTEDNQIAAARENLDDSLCEDMKGCLEAKRNVTDENNVSVSPFTRLETTPLLLEEQGLTGNSDTIEVRRPSPSSSSTSSSKYSGSLDPGSPSILNKRTPPKVSTSSLKVKPSFGKKKKQSKTNECNETASLPLLEASLPLLEANTSSLKNHSETTNTRNDDSTSDLASNTNEEPKIMNKKGNSISKESKITSKNVQNKKTKKILSSEEKEARKEKCERMKSEREIKKKENEQKKAEREQMKIEREKLKEQKRLDAEQKKVEREQAKIDRELKKIEKIQKKIAGKTKEQRQPEKVPELKESNSFDVVAMAEENKENKEPLEGGNVDFGNINDKKNENTDLDAENSCTSEDVPGPPILPIIGNNKMNDVKVNQEEGDLFPESRSVVTLGSLGKDCKKNAMIDSELRFCEKDRTPKITPKEKSIKRFEPPKQKNQESKPPKPKKMKLDSNKKEKQICLKTTHEKKSAGRSSTRSKNPKKKRRATFGDSSDSEEDLVQQAKRPKLAGPVWVQCDNIGCQKWRKLTNCEDPSELPEEWMCSRNTDSKYNKCSAPQEEWSADLKDSQEEFVESTFVPGSIVWAKLEGYPWWPAMIEEDPDTESYYEINDRRSKIPDKYHVVFFDTPVSRGWINAYNIQLLSDVDDANDEARLAVAKKHKNSLQNSMKQAKIALKKTLKERLSLFGFAKRFYHVRNVNSKKNQGSSKQESCDSRQDSKKPVTNFKQRYGIQKSANISTEISTPVHKVKEKHGDPLIVAAEE